MTTPPVSPPAPLISLTWTDHVTGREGHLVVDRLVRGVASGGLRMRAGCTLDEVAGLARGMTMKEALHFDADGAGARYIPLGGAKGGIDCDPRDPAAYGILVRYLRAVRPYVENIWTTGEDLGLTQDLVDRAAAEAGLVSTVQAVYPLLDDEAGARRRLADAFAVEVDGIGLDELAGGCGVAESALAALDRAGVAHRDARVSVQGVGTMGGATARFLSRAGLRVVAVADVKGTIANPAGLDVEALLAARDSYGTVDRAALRDTDRELPADAWLAQDADVLVPRPSPTPSTSPTRPGSRPAGWSRPRTCRSCRRPRNGSPRAGSPCCPMSSSTPVPTPGGGGPCSATSARTRTRPSRTSAARCALSSTSCWPAPPRTAARRARRRTPSSPTGCR